MTSANSGSVTAAAGALALNGSNETVTTCRFATAKAMMMTASGTRTTKVTILRSNLRPRYASIPAPLRIAVEDHVRAAQASAA